MGSSQSKPSLNYEHDSEMARTEDFSTEEDPGEPLRTMEELREEKEVLKKGVNELADAINQIFQNVETDTSESVQEMEQRLQIMTASYQKHVKHLTKHLERHAKIVNQGKEANEAVMAEVIDLVRTVNSYMTMLIRNIRKLKGLISETEKTRRGEEKEDLYSFWRRNNQVRNEKLIYDVISDHQDVDAMLVQLIETEAHREELESDIVTVLVCWRIQNHYVMDSDEDNIGRIEQDVIAAADSVAHGLAQLNCNKRIFSTVKSYESS